MTGEPLEPKSPVPPAAKYRVPAVAHAFSLDDIYRRVCPLSIIFAHTLYEYEEATQSIGRALALGCVV
jgi:hypothetical protein